MPPARLSFVVPTYNRRELLPVAVDSALAWLDQIGGGQIIIVDDGSKDGTDQMVRQRYQERLQAGEIVFHERARNGGAAAAKNTGASLADGDWIVFLDSDDALIEEAALPVVEELGRAGEAPAVFFRCVEKSTGALVGEPLQDRVSLNLTQHVSQWKWGECLPIVRSEASRRFPYVEELPGYESISYFRMIREIGKVTVSPIVARIYQTEGNDRVSAAGRLVRSIRNKTYALIMLGEFRRDLPLRIWLRFVLTYAKSRADNLLARGSRLLSPAR